MIDWNIAEKNKQFEKNLRGILDDMYYESINREGANVNMIKEITISRICLLHETYMKCLMDAIAKRLLDA